MPGRVYVVEGAGLPDGPGQVVLEVEVRRPGRETLVIDRAEYPFYRLRAR